MVDYIDLKQGERRQFWYLLTNEERSWVIYKAYNQKILSKEEIAPLLAKDRMNNVFTHALPLGMFPLAYWALPQVYTPAAKVWKKPGLALASGLLALPFFIAWRRTNPFRKSLTEEREKLLGTIRERVGYTYLLNLNEMLPRWMTDFEIHRRLRQLRNRKNGWFRDLLYPSEETFRAQTGIDAFRKPVSMKITQ